MEGGRILVVEDSTPVLRQIEQYLVEAGFSVVTAKSGVEAMGKVYESQPDLVISDIRMPGMDGYEFVRRFRDERGENIPFIFLSVNTSMDDKLLAFELGGDDYITKPFSMEELVARARVSLNRVMRFKQESSTDFLTGILNRRAIMEKLCGEIQRSHRLDHPFSLAIVDIDHFKSVNDKHGHPVGDEALRNLAGYFVSKLRSIDMVGRYGGEEFMIIMPATSKRNAYVAMERLRGGLETKTMVKANRADVSLRVSVGVAEYPNDATSADRIICAADEALYASKMAGRNKVTLFSPEG